ncbi:MAG: cytochrome c oxidase subunit II [Ilumatobacteraceae bacterium]
MTARRRTLSALGALAALAVLGGCAKNAPQDTWAPAGENARSIDNLQRPVFAVAGIVLVIVCVAVAYCVVRFRDKGQPMPEQTHGKPALEIALTILPALILVGVGIPTVSTIFKLAKTSDTECVINVTGQQWWWEYDYPVQDGCGGIDEPIVTSGQMVFPAGAKVLVRGTSRDVIHSFWIPRLNGKRDMVPGRVHTLRMQADQPGIYAGQCTEFCGLSHANMKMEAVALSVEDFETWKAEQLKEYDKPEEGSLAAKGEATFTANCAYCHQVNGLSTPAPGGGTTPVLANPDQYIVSGAAPNLSHLMSRNTFAGATWDLLTQTCRDEVWKAPSDEFGALYLQGVTADCLNEVDLREWLRNAPAKKPMYASESQKADNGGKVRGMPALGLSESQIDEIIAYLLTRK